MARETIATKLQRILNGFAIELGLTISKVEIRLIDPPEDIKKEAHGDDRKFVAQQRKNHHY